MILSRNYMAKRKRFQFISLQIAFVIFCSSVFSQTLKLPDAINIALKNSLDLEVLKNNVEINNINNNIGMAGGLPLITNTTTFNEQVTNVNQKLISGTTIKRTGATGNNLNSGINASILLYNGSYVTSTKNKLVQLQAQSEQFLNSLIQNVVAAVVTAYYDVVRQQSYMKTIDRSIGASQKKLDIVKAQQNVGMANNADLFQSQLDLNALLQSKLSQQSVIDQSKTQLLLLLSLRPDSIINVIDTIVVDKTVVLGDILAGLEKNADIIAADDQIKINELISKQTAALRYPSLRANTSYSYSRSQISASQILLNQNNGLTGGFTLGIPIYNGSIYKRQQKVAEINTKNAVIQKEILERNYSANAVKTYQAYSSALQQLETQQKNVELAGKLLDLVLLRFQLRQATILEVETAQQTFENAAYTLTNLSFAAKSSEIELKRLINQIKF